MDAVLLCNCLVRGIAPLIQFSHFFHLPRHKLGTAVIVAMLPLPTTHGINPFYPSREKVLGSVSPSSPGCTSLAGCIPLVGLIISKPEVLRIYARWVVAGMANKHFPGINAVVNHVRDAMGSIILAIYGKCPVPIGVPAAPPLPAMDAFATHHFFEKSVYVRIPDLVYDPPWFFHYYHPHSINVRLGSTFIITRMK